MEIANDNAHAKVSINTDPVGQNQSLEVVQDVDKDSNDDMHPAHNNTPVNDEDKNSQGSEFVDATKGWILPNFNANNVLSLFQKSSNADTVDQFRPIAMANFKFKVISKILADRGVRQGDPLSPLLFCLAEEVLSRSISKLVVDGRHDLIEGTTNSLVPSHILYADDILIFCRGTISNIRALPNLFLNYAEISGQMVNSTI
ncbi:RNA-directed DNA polymerase (Reverse transcriptase) [Trifolium medium]|uniref:RNA-directed DNA polymerase (Reverse transcriptase) n=1 Tax=Trifolium medium TaxID=97028 RepID=A0A392M7I1_9FABA|nr:RNA-directed DNA polymerase (Reverse transcriptase) [Trifolium medium]